MLRYTNKLNPDNFQTADIVNKMKTTKKQKVSE